VVLDSDLAAYNTSAGDTFQPSWLSIQALHNLRVGASSQKMSLAVAPSVKCITPPLQDCQSPSSRYLKPSWTKKELWLPLIGFTSSHNGYLRVTLARVLARG